MSDYVIKIEILSKFYMIRHQQAERYIALRDVLAKGANSVANRLLRRKDTIHDSQPATREEFWALNNVSFEVKQGERVGIIGRNGAGKSTLLKILSRITEPTKGRIHIKGRVASLLEVGTGFHPELTGRENIYLNGAILGMNREEIRRKFDEIVAFAEVEKFLDTPVKRYSSGMYVRLAFAVAAHLEPEILVVDEVLAVGDAEFQKKCLGKMNDVAEKEGRTVLFVSHNMVAVQALCNRALLLRKGNVEIDAGVEPVIQYYLSATPTELAVPLQERFDRKGNGLIRFASFAFENFEGSQSSQIRSGEDTIFVLGYTADRPISLDKVAVAIVVSSLSGQRLCTFYSEFTGNKFSGKSTFGEFKCFVPKLPLASGIYKVNLWSSIAGEILDWIQDAATFEIVDGDYFGTGRMPNVSVHGPFLINHWWEQTDQG